MYFLSIAIYLSSELFLLLLPKIVVLLSVALIEFAPCVEKVGYLGGSRVESILVSDGLPTEEIASNVGVSFGFNRFLAGLLQGLSISVGDWRVQHEEGLVKGLGMPFMMRIYRIFLLSFRVSNTRLLKLCLIEILP